MTLTPRESWATKIGLILALAGNAIGLGNFLRFPVQAASNGGGAFMIPYFLALFLLGLPLMWAELAIGRMGGAHGHGTTPGMFSLLWRNPASKYLGVFGIFIPLTVFLYYCYIESWTLGYSFFSLTGKYFGNTTREGMSQFLTAYQGIEPNQYFSGIKYAYIFFLITFAANFWVIARGISGGIEKFAKIAMPTLLIFAVVLVVRTFFVGTPDPVEPQNNVTNGLGFIWNPDFSRLKDVSVWLAAAGQIFFTLSVGWGIIHTYASYIKKNDDVALSGLATVSTNEFAEVVCGGTIAIPIACAFFGVVATQEIAKAGAFNLGFVAMPVIFQKIPLGQILGAMWFLLLFFAGVTSSVALIQPAVAFLKDELKVSHKKAVSILAVVLFIASQPAIFFLSKGFLDEMDFWAGTVALPLFALIESILFAWVFGMKKGWAEIMHGAEIRIPIIFKWIIKYITPVYLLALFCFWAFQQAPKVLRMEGVPAENHVYLWGARALIIAVFVALMILIKIAWARKKEASYEHTRVSIHDSGLGNNNRPDGLQHVESLEEEAVS